MKLETSDKKNQKRRRKQLHSHKMFEKEKTFFTNGVEVSMVFLDITSKHHGKSYVGNCFHDKKCRWRALPKIKKSKTKDIVKNSKVSILKFMLALLVAAVA